jgi:hypothetical protein
MARMPFFCRCCNTSYDAMQALKVCEHCHNDYARVKVLYTRIVSERPKLKNREPHEVFAALYEAFKSLEK